MTRKSIRKLIYHHRLYRGHEPRLAALDDRARRDTLSPRNARERIARYQDKARYEKSIQYRLCTLLTKCHLWEVTWVFCPATDKVQWREIVSKF